MRVICVSDKVSGGCQMPLGESIGESLHPDGLPYQSDGCQIGYRIRDRVSDGSQMGF